MKIKHTITKKSWDALHKDYKSIIDGVPYVLMMEKIESGDKATCLVPVEITKGKKYYFGYNYGH